MFDRQSIHLNIECVCLCLMQSLSHCEMITDEGVRHVGSGACATDSLTVLELDNCPLISDAALDHLTSCAVLQRVEVYDCQLITRAGIRRLKVRAQTYIVSIIDRTIVNL